MSNRARPGTGRRKPNAARTGFRPGIHSDMNPCGQAVADQLGLPGDRATTPAPQYEVEQWPNQPIEPQNPYPQPLVDFPPPQVHEQQLALPLVAHHFAPEYFHPQPQSDLPPPQIQGHQSHTTYVHRAQLQMPGMDPSLPLPQNQGLGYQPNAHSHHIPQIPEYESDQARPSQMPRSYYQPDQVRFHPPQPLYHHEGGEGMAHAQSAARANARTLIQLEGEGPTLVPQLGSGDGPMAQWGATRLIALAPRHPGENIRGERTQGVIRTKSHISDASRRRRQVRLPPTPALPPALPPAQDTNVRAPAPTDDNPLQSIGNAGPPGPVLASIVSLTSQMARQYRDLAKGNLLALVLNVADDTDAAPGQQMRDKMIDTALQAAKAELFGQSTIEEPKNIHDYMVTSLAEMRRGFKTYALNVVHLGYGLRPPPLSSINEATHKRDKIRSFNLMEGLQYLESRVKACTCSDQLAMSDMLLLMLTKPQTLDGPDIVRPLEHEVLINMVTDNMLSGGLSKMLNGRLDRLFALCGAAIYCVLSSYTTGAFEDVSVNSPIFDRAYKNIMAYITDTIRTSDDSELCARFDSVQHDILSRV